MNNMNISKKQLLVYTVIQANPGCQNNDADLIAAVWRHENWSDGRSLEENISRVTRSETITRRRRELFNMGLITYSDKAMKDRTEAFKSEQNAHSDYEKSFYGMFGVSSQKELLDSFPKLKRIGDK
jgi:hypothetical protein